MTAIEVPEAPPVFGSQKAQDSRWLGAVILGVLMVGLGHIYAGAAKRAAGWFGVAMVVGLTAFAVIAYLPVEHLNAAIGYALLLGVYLSSVVDAGVVAMRRRHLPRQPYQRWWVYLFVWLGAFCVVKLFGEFERRLWLHGFYIPTAGMADTILPGDRFIADLTWYRFRSIERGHVVVYLEDGVAFVQRVVGLPGDRIEVDDDGAVIVNGVRPDEPYAIYRNQFSPYPELVTPLEVPEGHVFLVGDNRHRSYDSRFKGSVPLSAIIGRVMTIYASHVPQPQLGSFGQPLPVDPTLAGETPGDWRWERFGRIVR